MISDDKAKKLYNAVSVQDTHVIESFRLTWDDLPEVTKNVYRYHASKKNDDDELFCDFDQTLALIVSRSVRRFVEYANSNDEVFLEHNDQHQIEEITRTFPRESWEEQSLLWCSRVLEQYALASYRQIHDLRADAKRAFFYIAANFDALYV